MIFAQYYRLTSLLVLLLLTPRLTSAQEPVSLQSPEFSDIQLVGGEIDSVNSSSYAIDNSDAIEELRSEVQSLRSEIEYLRPLAHEHQQLSHRETESAWFVQYDNVFIRPHFDRNVAFTEDDGPGDPDADREVRFNWSFQYSPRVIFGWQGETGTGWVVTYLNFDHSTTVTGTAAGNNELFVEMNTSTSNFDFFVLAPDSVTVTHGLEMHVIDLEASHQEHFHWGTVRGTAGIRLIDLSQSFFAERNGGPVAFIRARHGIRGVGPTTSVMVSRDLASGFSLFAQGRGAILFGDRSIHLTEDGGDTLDIDGYENFMPVLETRIGAAWTAELIGGWQFVLESAFEGQAWFGAGSAWASNDDEGGLLPTDSDMGLIGFSLGAGFLR